jgi:hypothetical protein
MHGFLIQLNDNLTSFFGGVEWLLCGCSAKLKDLIATSMQHIINEQQS